MRKGLLCFLFSIKLFAANDTSISSKMQDYLDSAKKAATTDLFYEFRVDSWIKNVYEHVSYKLGQEFAEAIADQFQFSSTLMDAFRMNDQFGSPETFNFPKIGEFSPTTLRYIYVLGEIMDEFDLPQEPKIVELGSGYGGQISILSKVYPNAKFDIIDLKEPLQLIDRYLSSMQVPNYTLRDPSHSTINDKYDLFISNYAISECCEEEQKKYLHEVVMNSKRGYILYNRIADNPMALVKFCYCLMLYGKDPKVEKEKISTFESVPNFRIIWDTTK